MTWKTRYEKQKKALLTDKSICDANRAVFKDFLKFLEYKLKRTNGSSELDDASFKTCYGYIHKLKNVNAWFKNKPWKDLTRTDIKKVYDDLEENRIKNAKNKPFKDKKSYYNKILRSKPFGLVGKTDIVRDVMQFSHGNHCEEVRFVYEDEFRKLVEVVSKLPHKALMWLAFDIGENINALLQLRKRDFVREQNPDTKDPEYRVNLGKEILKRSRKARNELTNYAECVMFLDMVLKDLKDEDFVFNFGYSNAKKFLDTAVKKSGVVCTPKGQAVTWKDLRSSMACDLLKKGWTRDEINARLGHTPSSSEIDKYINFLAIDRHKPKKKVEEHAIMKLREEVRELKEQYNALMRVNKNLGQSYNDMYDRLNDELAVYRKKEGWELVKVDWKAIARDKNVEK